MRERISPAKLRDLFIYDPDTGILTNRVARHVAKVGERAGCVNYEGYRSIKIFGRKYMSSHVIWAYVTGAWPVSEMDHINLQRGDDRLVNLREATREQNCANKGSFFKANSFGFRGVKKAGSKFIAVICAGQKEICVGRYETAEFAALAYDVAAKRMHKQFARFNFPEKMHRDWLLV